MSSPSATEVLEFWFSPAARSRWFASEPAFDDEIRSRFGQTVAEAGNGALGTWMDGAPGALALVIVLDQFSRNIHRGSRRAFEHDPQARLVADRAIDRGLDLRVALDRQRFFYLPFQHSEDQADQLRSVQLFRRWAERCRPDQRAEAEDEMVYVRRHEEIIRRFGRFPHRNAVLGRRSTQAEQAFLAEPGSAF